MANVSSQTTVLTNVRAVGRKDQNGNQFGGIYYPAHTKNGKPVSARWEGNVALNSKPYTDDQGVRHEGRRDYLRLVVWNSKNAAAGKGLADTFAKCVSVGKELSCNVKIHSFDKRVFVNGQPLLDGQGNAITMPSINFRVDGEVIFGDDSARVITAEIGAYQGQINFHSRPQFWNVQGHADNDAWKNIVAARMASSYDGQSGSYGYAQVIIPEGAQVAQVPQAMVTGNAAAVAPQPQPGMAPTAAAQTLMQPQVGTPAAPVAPVAPVMGGAATPL